MIALKKLSRNYLKCVQFYHGNNTTQYLSLLNLSISILYQLYLDLKVVKNWKEFKIKEAPSESLCYLIGKKDPKSKEEIIIPVNVNAPFKVSKYDSFENFKLITFRLHQLFQELSALEGREVENFVMGIMSSDSSLTYYKIHSSLVPPKE